MAVPLPDEHGFGAWGTAAHPSQGAALGSAYPGQAGALIGDALAKLQGLRVCHPHILSFKAEALLRLGRDAKARAAIDSALTIAESGGVIW